jgi:DNA-binding transcriptional LysR family regulator
MTRNLAIKHKTTDWDDLRVFLAVARTGTLSGAARVLGVNHSTVFRRLAAFEQQLGVRLFDRLPTGYVRTLAGEEMMESAAAIEEQVAALERRVTGRDLELQGTLRVTTTDTIAMSFGPSHITAFHAVYPGIVVELSALTERVSLSRRDADVAIRPTNTPPESVVGRRVARIAMAVYCAASRLDVPSFGSTAFWSAPWIDGDETLAHLSGARWLGANIAPGATVFRGNALTVLHQACRAGLGLALLPCYLADGDGALQRVGAPVPDLAIDLWLLTHEDLRQTARVRAFLDFMAESIAADRDLIEGRRPQG